MTYLEEQDIKTIAELPYKWDILRNKSILISGGTGFIGQLLIEVFLYRNRLFDNDINIISLSRSGGNSIEKVEYLKEDVTNPIQYKGNLDYIIHLASNTHPKQYSVDPVGTITTNVLGCNNLLTLAKEKNIQRFLLASSVEIYGQGNESPMNEEYSGYINCNDARSGYNESKRTCEALCQSYRKQYGIDSVTVRLARVFGADYKKDTKAMAQFMEKAVEGDDIVLKSYGTQRYSYCYVADAVSAIIKVLTDGNSGEAYNVSEDDEEKTLGQYAEFLAHLANRNILYNINNDDSVSKATYAILDCKKIKNLGWNPIYSVSQGLERTYNIYKLRKQHE